MGTQIPTAVCGLALPRSTRYLSLDVWRGVACLLVCVFHSTIYVTPAETAETPTDIGSWLIAGIARMWIGVPIFFVISGYCIAAAAESVRRGRLGLGAYLYRRVRRIYPPYLIVFGLTVLVVLGTERIWPGLVFDGLFWEPPWDLSARQWVGNLTLTESWLCNLGDGKRHLFLGVAWTLCYEEQFYLVVGLLVAVFPSWFYRAVAVLTGLVALNTMNLNRFVGWLGLDWNSHQLRQVGTFYDGFWLDFAGGVLVFYAVNHAARRGRVVAAGVLALGLLYAARVPAVLCLRAHQDLDRFVAFGFALFLLLIHPWDAQIATASATRPLRFCGRMCYSVYLIHWPVSKIISHGMYLVGVTTPAWTLLLTVPLVVVATVALAWVFHNTVEQRFITPPALAPTGGDPVSANRPSAEEAKAVNPAASDEVILASTGDREAGITA